MLRENVKELKVNVIPDVVKVKIPRHVSDIEDTDFVTEAPLVIGWIVVVVVVKLVLAVSVL